MPQTSWALLLNLFCLLGPPSPRPTTSWIGEHADILECECGAGWPRMKAHLSTSAGPPFLSHGGPELASSWFRASKGEKREPQLLFAFWGQCLTPRAPRLTAAALTASGHPRDHEQSTQALPARCEALYGENLGFLTGWTEFQPLGNLIS